MILLSLTKKFKHNYYSTSSSAQNYTQIGSILIDMSVRTTAQMNVKYDKRIALDCKTRWNSTYLIVELGRNLINYVIQLLKMVLYHIRWVSNGYPKPDGHGYGYEFLPVDIVMGGYYL